MPDGNQKKVKLASPGHHVPPKRILAELGTALISNDKVKGSSGAACVLQLLLIFFSHTAFSSQAFGADAEVPVMRQDSEVKSFASGLPKQAKPVEITVSFDLRDINNIDDEAETVELTGVMKLAWHDPRQAFDPQIEGTDEKIFQGEFQFNEVFDGWFPQLILVNESGLYEKHGVLLRVESDGSMSLFETINASAKIDLDLRRYPIDKQRLELVFHVLGFDRNDILLRLKPGFNDGDLDIERMFRMPQWHLTRVKSSIGTRKTPLIDKGASTSTFVVSIDLQRRAFFILRLVVLPLIVIVMLSWSVFWMDKSSLGDRISVSFIGILTAVTYQVIVSEILPKISYFTAFNDGFLNISFFVMCMTVVVNLRVSYLDRQGKSEAGDRLDHRCRWLFPLVYFSLLLVNYGMAALLLPEFAPYAAE